MHKEEQVEDTATCAPLGLDDLDARMTALEESVEELKGHMTNISGALVRLIRVVEETQVETKIVLPNRAQRRAKRL